jgi:hypothetical protein
MNPEKNLEDIKDFEPGEIIEDEFLDDEPDEINDDTGTMYRTKVEKVERKRVS